MKTIRQLFFLLLLMLSVCETRASYRMLKDEDCWLVFYESENGLEYDFAQIDALHPFYANDKKYLTLNVSHNMVVKGYFGNEDSYYYSELYYRVDGSRLFRYDPSKNEEIQMFDFGHAVGDTLTDGDGNRMRVEEVSDPSELTHYSLLNYGEKAYRLKGVDNPSLEDVWVDNVGSVKTGIFRMSDFDSRTAPRLSSFSNSNSFYAIAFELNFDNLKSVPFTKRIWEGGERPKPYVHYEFIADTLHIRSLASSIFPDNYDAMHAMISGDIITVNYLPTSFGSDDFNNHAPCEIDVRIPGFKKGEYLIKTNFIWLDVVPDTMLTCHGNAVVPFVEEGKVWRMIYNNPEISDIVPDYEYSYFIKGDTLIAGRECKKLYGFNERNDRLTRYKLSLFEEDDKVYFIPVQSDEHYVLYDFSDSFRETTKVSSSAHPGNSIMMRLFERKTVNINGTERLCLHLNRQWDNQDEIFWDFPTGWWIQGVGSILGPLNNWGFSNSGNLNHFISCEVNGETIFTTSEFMERFVDDVYLLKCIQQTGFNMFTKLAENPESVGNLCFSPLSAQLVLSMVANGASGKTLREMNKALGIYGYPDYVVNYSYYLLTESLTTRPPFNPEQWNGYGDEEEALQQYEAAYPICEIANSVWHRPEVSLFESFTNVLKSYYDAGFGSAEFDTPEGIALVNSWANDKTHGMIPTIFDEPLRPDIAVVLADALYFKGSWTTPFEKEKTQPGRFHLTDGSAVNIDMMSAHSEYRLSENGKFRAVTLPYGAGDFSMTLVVPFEGFTLPELTRDDWMMAMSPGSKPAHVSLTMPKFSIDGRYDLEPVMKSLGMVEAFGGSADFSRMSDIALFIDEAFQLSKIAVDEDGTEASAVSVVTMEKNAIPSSDYEDFRVDRPFYFTIENRKEQCVLFVGRVTTLPDTSVSRFDGDVNDDGETNISDIVTIINVMAGKDAGTGTEMNAPAAKAKSDVNHDGKTDISDITAVINIMAGQK